MAVATDARVDEYIASARPFAQPLLQHFRTLVHRNAPDCEETIKWRMPFFTVDGKILGNMGAFQQHCSFGIWNAEVAADIARHGGTNEKSMGSFGRIAALADLPHEKILSGYIKKAAEDVRAGKKRQAKTPHTRGVVLPDAPADFLASLKKNKAAQQHWEQFAPSHKREYLEWLLDAKREETRSRRLTQAVEWIAEGKGRNWKYEAS